MPPPDSASAIANSGDYVMVQLARLGADRRLWHGWVRSSAGLERTA